MNEKIDFEVDVPGFDAKQALEMTDRKDVIEEATEALKEDLSENIYELKGANDLISVIPTMNYMELSKLQRDMTKEIENLQSAMKLIESIEGMSDVDDIGRKIALGNILNDKEYKKDISGFKRTYEENYNKLTEVNNTITSALSKYEGVPKGTKFLTEHMVDTLTKAISRFTGVEDQHTKELNVLRVTLEAYKDRTSFDYLISKGIEDDICTIKAELIRNTGKCIRLTMKQFMTIFSEEQILAFNKYITAAFDNNEKATINFLCHLGKLIKSGKESGHYNFIKVIVMNVLDIIAGVYDLEGGKEEFDKKLKDIYEIYK